MCRTLGRQVDPCQWVLTSWIQVSKKKKNFLDPVYCHNHNKHHHNKVTVTTIYNPYKSQLTTPKTYWPPIPTTPKKKWPPKTTNTATHNPHKLEPSAPQLPHKSQLKTHITNTDPTQPQLHPTPSLITTQPNKTYSSTKPNPTTNKQWPTMMRTEIETRMREERNKSD